MMPRARFVFFVAFVAAALGLCGEAARAQQTVDEARVGHWSYQPIRRPVLPGVRDAGWGRTRVDRFILASLEGKGMTPAPEADRRTLIRRLSFDLVGLPPSYREVEAFVNDPAPDAVERLVDRLLDSPAYGQRWGRHWLDVARYADTMGYNFQGDPRYPFAWTYRDYVVDAFNADKPFDRFVLEQIAADRLDLGGSKKALAAMGFLTVGRRFDSDVHSTIDDRIDVVTRGLMGLTVACARCHDHKYDAIPTADYYGLYGVFRSSTEPDVKDLPIIDDAAPPGGREQFEAELAQRQQAVEDFVTKLHASIIADAKAQAGGYIQAVTGKSPEGAALRPALVLRFRTEWEKLGSPAEPTGEQAAEITAAVCGLTRDEARTMVTPAERGELAGLQNRVIAWHVESPDAPPRAMVMYDAEVMFAPYIYQRGQPGNRGEAVPRRFLSVLAADVGGEPFKDGSGRLELAQAITHPSNPLTARVLVNRIWQHHFGHGLVRTPSDFGVRGEPPTHPELLDDLARSFIDSGWSIKKLHRAIVLSAAYRQSCTDRPDYAQTDPENRLLWRQNRRRLEFEPMRDALLHAAGRLDLALGGRPGELVEKNYTHRRSIYGTIDRQYLSHTLRTFDFASPDASCPQRSETTVPQQSLFMMNAPFVAAQVHHLFSRVELAGVADDAELIRRLYQVIVARDPSPAEVELGLAYIAYERETHTEGKLAPWAKYGQALVMSNEFLFVD